MAEGAKAGSWGSALEQYLAVFLGRDLSYLFSGALLNCFAYYLWQDEFLLPLLDGTLAITGFAFGSYFVGFMLTEAGFACHIMRRQEKNLNHYEEEFYYFAQANRIFDAGFFREQERGITLMVMRGSVGMVLLASALLLLAKTAWSAAVCAFHGTCALSLLGYVLAAGIAGMAGCYLTNENQKAGKRQGLKFQAVKNIVDRARRKKYKELLPF